MEVDVNANSRRPIATYGVVRQTIQASKTFATLSEDWVCKIAIEVTQLYKYQEETARMQSGA